MLVLTICQTQDHSMQNSYQVLKKELHGHNAATFRKMYYENAPSSQVHLQTTVNSEYDFFNKRLVFENVESTYESPKNFIVIGNFINKCEPRLQSFIKENNPKAMWWDAREDIQSAKNSIFQGATPTGVLHGVERNIVYKVRVQGYGIGGHGRKSPPAYFTLGKGNTIYLRQAKSTKSLKNKQSFSNGKELRPLTIFSIRYTFFFSLDDIK
ncbi:uncharacterized protein LOC129929013 [Biomphalaria glabrata]|uniref:Uncharacterized protein LOC129929013 n=1 Tax=Biomphalaria glabrata TaxID=6526 RepID=A0A9W3BQ96_BIOGL|nr:uncharacterized protein LOC129929013 [Biomphalaria glabrata]